MRMLTTIQPALLFFTVCVAIFVLLSEVQSSNNDGSIIFKKRSEWTPDERKEYHNCRANRRKHGKKLTHLYLIPKRSESCNKSPTDNMEVTDLSLLDATSKTKVLKFPGCYDVEGNIDISHKSPLLKGWPKGRIPNWVAYINWELQTGTDGISGGLFKDIECKGKDRNGCGGVGNKCYHCNFCKSVVEKEQKKSGILKKDITTCPTGTGHSKLKKKGVCFDDWGSMDEEKDGEPDFICYPNMGPYRELMESVSGSGYGHIKFVLLLARNDTQKFKQAKLQHPGSKFGEWHKGQMKYLINQNLLSCAVVILDVCLQPPIMVDGEPMCGPALGPI